MMNRQQLDLLLDDIAAQHAQDNDHHTAFQAGEGWDCFDCCEAEGLAPGLDIDNDDITHHYGTTED
jgi:hypothetical protein